MVTLYFFFLLQFFIVNYLYVSLSGAPKAFALVDMILMGGNYMFCLKTFQQHAIHGKLKNVIKTRLNI